MKTSFYFVLWQLVWLFIILLNIPFLNEYGFLSACIIVFFADRVIKKFLKKQIEYQRMCEAAFIMEIAYNNDYKQYKRQAFLQMIVYVAIFVYMTLCFIALFISYSDVPLIDYILWGALMILTGLSSSWNIKSYIQTVKAGQVILDKRLQEFYPSYKSERDTCTYEKMLLPRPKYYQAMNATNVVFAVLCIVIGLLTSIVLYSYREDISQLLQISLTIWGMLAIYSGVKDLLSTSNSSKILLLIFSCVFVALLYMPLINYINKNSLLTYIAYDKNLVYDTKANLIQETIECADITGFELTYMEKRFILALSREERKKLLEKIVSINAEYQAVYRDSLGKEQVISIAPSKLKEIYRQTISDLDICLELLKLDLSGSEKESSIKVYEDGEYIIIELWGDNVPYPTQSEQINFSTWLAKFIKECAEDYNIIYFNRGLKMRFIFSNHQFIEHTLSLEEIRKEKNDANLDESEKDSNGLIGLFLGNSTDN